MQNRELVVYRSRFFFKKGSPMFYSTTYPSPLGLITIASTEDALVSL
ncbi:MAG: hypothetical protein IKT25_05625 [Firmicutes bacterium]|nr:hypothetical protein [Bacillota bacterium]MBR6500973.1 hypothetical protein [Bacillota bacterium]